MLLYFSAVLVLAARGALGEYECTYKGQTYNNHDNIPHDNGCARQQCQYGQVVTFHEACGKDIDGNCHNLNFMFVAKKQTYQCRKDLIGVEFVYVNEIAIPRVEDCKVGDKTYKSLEKFHEDEECREYQCQNGAVIPLDPVCGREIDGNCHVVNEIFEHHGVVYICTKTEIDDDNTVFEYEAVEPQPTGTRGCNTTAGEFANFDLFRILPLCHIRQCQNKKVSILLEACALKKPEGITCLNESELFYQGNTLYFCTFNSTKNQLNVEIVSKGYGKCKRSEHWYNHLEVHQRPFDCTSEQCQDGKTLPVIEGCLSSIDKQCHDLNYVWKVKDQTFKCIITNESLYRIVELDKDGNIIEKIIPTPPPPVFGKLCPSFKADIVVILDASGSIVRATFQQVLNFVSTLASAFTIGPNNTHIALIVFSDKAVLEFKLSDNEDYDSLDKAIHAAKFLGDITETQKALDLVVDQRLFAIENGGREEAPNVVILVTDGNSTNTTQTLASAERVKLYADVIVVGVGHIAPEELYGIANDDHNVYTIQNYSEIYNIITTLSKRTCEVIVTVPEPPTPEPTPPVITTPAPPTVCPPPVGIPCSQIFVRTPDGFKCACREGYQVSKSDPTQCEVTPCPDHIFGDFIFVIDSSDSIGDENYIKAFEFVFNVVNSFTIGPDDVRVAALIYSWSVKKLFDLNTFSNKEDIKEALYAAPYLRQSTLTFKGLTYVDTYDLFGTARGGRVNATKVVFLLTDGKSERSDLTIRAAKLLKSKDITIITIGISDLIDKKELSAVASSPEATFYTKSYDVLEYIESEVVHYTCKV